MSTALRFAPALLAASILVRLAWVTLTPNGMNLVDLHVYVDGSASLLRGDLYDYTYADQTPGFPLPFTYPPFAALVFFPLHYLPFGFVGWAWQVLTVLGLYALIRMSITLLLGENARNPKWRAVAMIWTAIGLWSEPIRTTLDYGQVNVFLALGAMLAVRSSRWWLSGGLVGFVAGIKLTPAITGLYFVARRRWATVVCSAAVFGATVGLSYLLIGQQARRYFGSLLGDASRIGPVGSVVNQSLRGALSRIVGYDVRTGPLLVACALVVAALAALAWRALDRDDRLGTLVVVELFGLVVSPISWYHHWVWIIPMLIWLVHGRFRHLVGTRVVAGYWLVTTMVGVAWVLSFFQHSMWAVSRPGLLAWLGTVDVLGVLIFYLWLICLGRRDRRSVNQDSPGDLSSSPSPHPTR